MDHAYAAGFVESWAAAWNEHDLDRILAHFADDAVFSSPIAAALLPDSRGVLVGKDEIRAYWQVGLERIPDLEFTVREIFTGVDVIVIRYENHAGGQVSEVLRLQDHLVVGGDGTYAVDDVTAASGVRS